MKKMQKLIDRIDTIRENSVTEKEFEKTWDISLDECVDELMDYWCKKEDEARKTIDVNNQTKG